MGRTRACSASRRVSLPSAALIPAGIPAPLGPALGSSAAVPAAASRWRCSLRSCGPGAAGPSRRLCPGSPGSRARISLLGGKSKRGELRACQSSQWEPPVLPGPWLPGCPLVWGQSGKASGVLVPWTGWSKEISLWWGVAGLERVAWRCVGAVYGGCWKKVLLPEDGWALE